MKTLIAFLLCAAGAFSQTLPSAVPLPNPEVQFLNQNGVPLAGGLVYTYAAGTTTPIATYTDSSAMTPNANPIILNSAGRASIWIGAAAIKLLVEDANSVEQWTQDNISDTTLYFVNYIASVGSATLIDYTDPISGAVSRTVSARLADVADLEDWGAKCDGSTDDTTAIQTAVNDTTSAGAALRLPSGVCIATALTLPSGVHISGLGKADSIIRQKSGSAVSGTPFVKNSNQSSGNTGIYLDGFTIDGNTANVAAGNVDAISFVKVTTVRVREMGFINIARAAIYGYGWNDIKILSNVFTGYGNSAATSYPNLGAIMMDYADATTTSTGIEIGGNTIDGSGGGVGGVKLNGTSTYTFSDIDVHDNIVTVGDSTGSLGIELYSNSGLGFYDCSVRGNVVRGVSASSPVSSPTYGISLAGSGGSNCAVTGNSIKWTGYTSIELAGMQNTSVTGNVVRSAGLLSIDAASGHAVLNVTVSGNTFYDPRFEPAGLAPALQVYSDTGGTVKNVSITGNTWTYVQNPMSGGVVIWAQCNGGGGTISALTVAENSFYGPGSADSVDGIILEQDSTCPVDSTRIAGNVFNSLRRGISFSGDTNTQVTTNTYLTMGTNYFGSPPSSDVFFEFVPGSAPSILTNAIQWTAYTPTITTPTGGSSLATSNVAAYYAQVGTLVFVRVYAVITVSGTAAGSVYVTVPVAPAATAPYFEDQSLAVSVHNNGGGYAYSVGAFLSDAGTSTFTIEPAIPVGGSFTAFPISTAMSFRMQGVYQAAVVP